MEKTVKEVIMQNKNFYEDIRNLIYTIRGKQVMLDSDVAMLYDYETKRINEAVRRNIKRFPESFCFQLTESEIENENYGGRRYLPYAFTEQGIAMLSGLLKNDIAIQVSINIMNAFVEMRRFLYANKDIFEKYVEHKLVEFDKKFDIVFNQLENPANIKQGIFFQGQTYDAYSLIINIIKTANKSITIIDNYIDNTILDMLSKKNKEVEAIILTSNKSNIKATDIEKFNSEYPTIKVVKTEKYHDRFLIIDNKELYHCGASIKDLGKKCFAINKMEDISIMDKLLTKI